MQTISIKGVGLRFLFALILVLSTFNPSGFSYIHWLIDTFSSPSPWLALIGIILIIGWVVFVHATLKSLGLVGLILSAVLVAVILWLFVDIGIISFDSTSAITWVLEVFIAAILCLGMSWSHIQRQMSGQADVDHL